MNHEYWIYKYYTDIMKTYSFILKDNEITMLKEYYEKINKNIKVIQSNLASIDILSYEYEEELSTINKDDRFITIKENTDELYHDISEYIDHINEDDKNTTKMKNFITLYRTGLTSHYNRSIRIDNININNIHIASNLLLGILISNKFGYERNPNRTIRLYKLFCGKEKLNTDEYDDIRTFRWINDKNREDVISFIKKEYVSCKQCGDYMHTTLAFCKNKHCIFICRKGKQNRCDICRELRTSTTKFECRLSHCTYCMKHGHTNLNCKNIRKDRYNNRHHTNNLMKK